MGAEESKGYCVSGRGDGWGSPRRGNARGAAAAEVDFPNSYGQLSEAMAWTLLHQCTLDQWKDGHAG